MAKRAIDDGFVDCPKYGIIDGMRCLPSCESHESKDDEHVVCCFGETRRATPTEEAAEPVAEHA